MSDSDVIADNPRETAAPARPGYGYARRMGVTMTAWHGDRAEVVCRADAASAALAELRRHLGVPIEVSRLGDEAWAEVLRKLYQEGGDASALSADLDAEPDLASVAEELAEPQDLMESEDDAPVIRLINALLAEAVRENASDIHIEPFESRLLVRFRVDGVLKEVLTPRRQLANSLVSRIKVMARLDIAEKRLPQDGRIGLKIAGRPVDVRVSTIPGSHGERVVLRLLDKQAGRLDLTELGMDGGARQRLQDMLARPHGILLVTGPTGSGKTTTLYAALSRLNDATRNIMTVEDPIEYYLDGVGQTQVNARVDMTFARGLRAILRQDPDVVMVGEIRDLETAEIAVQASLTGHLVLSTLHTNSAVGAVTRLQDMGVEPFLLSSSLIGVLAQRLVRRLDSASREAFAAGQAELAAFGRPDSDLGTTLYRPGAGGYHGRSGIYELVPVDETMRTLIHGGAAEAELERHARTLSPSILDDGWRVARAGLTSVEEVLRVTRER